MSDHTLGHRGRLVAALLAAPVGFTSALDRRLRALVDGLSSARRLSMALIPANAMERPGVVDHPG
jgi:hypothetical protein